jgi:hypothetical protein
VFGQIVNFHFVAAGRIEAVGVRVTEREPVPSSAVGPKVLMIVTPVDFTKACPAGIGRPVEVETSWTE